MLNKKIVENFRGDFAKAVAQLEKQYGVNIELGTITFNSSELRGKLSAKLGDAVVQSTRNDFNVGDIVGINHTKVDPNTTFKIVKINNKNIKVQTIVGDNKVGGFVNVSPSLLVKK